MSTLLGVPDGTYKILGKYQSPQGDGALLKQLAQFLSAEFGWQITDRNVAISNGGQSAFLFCLICWLVNVPMAASNRSSSLVPEYLGYKDAGLEADFFSSTRPAIDIVDEHVFKYRVNFESLEVTDKTAALCVSRPTNPTGMC